MAWLMILAVLLAVCVSQPVPSRQYDSFTVLSTVTAQKVDNGFRLGNRIFWSSPDAAIKGPGSLIVVDINSSTTSSFSQSNIAFTGTQKFVKGWAHPTIAGRSWMVLNEGGSAILRQWQSTFSYATTTDEQPDCNEEIPPVCAGTTTTTLTRLVVNHQTAGPLLTTGLSAVSGDGEADFSKNRIYLISNNVNFSIYVIDTAPATPVLLRTIPVTGPNSTTGNSKKTALSDDGTTLYILTTSNNFYRVTGINTTAPVVDLIMTFPAKYTPLSFIVSDKWKEALFTTAGFPSYIAWVDLEQRRIYETEQFTTLFSPQVVVKDAGAGFAYVVGFNRPSLVMRVNLASHGYDTPFNARDTGRSANGFIDPSTATIWIASNGQSVGIQYPGNCPLNCSGRGTCEFGGTCECFAGFTGSTCQFLACPAGKDRQTCSANGVCGDNGTCVCFPGYTGDVCQDYTCANGCGGQGTCDIGSHVCTCNPGWTGVDCGTSLMEVCGQASGCNMCSQKPQCVWCESNATCILGDVNGPLLEYCPNWHYRTCNWLPFRIVGWFFVGITFFFLILNIILNIIDDLKGPEVLYDRVNIVRSLWTSQRDLQTWIMIEQVQIGALVAYYSVPVASTLKSWLEPVSVMLLSVKPVWQSSQLPVIATRVPLSLTQVAVTKGTHPMDLMAGSFFVFLLMISAVMVYGIFGFLSQKDMFKWRTTHILLRVIQFAQPGLCSLGAWTITQIGTDYSGARNPIFSFAAAFISVFGLGLIYPLVVLVFVTTKQKDLFTPATRTQFGSWYDTYHHDKLWYGAVAIFKVGCISMFIGFFADAQTGYFSPVMSMLMPIIVTAIYIVTTIVARPFIDKIRGIIQVIMLGFFNIMMFGITIIYLNFEPFDGWAVAVAAIVGGAIFFTILMWIMNAIRVGQVNKPQGEPGTDYIRM